MLFFWFPDVPGAPTGPLEATEVKADEITLQWKAPHDDGGEPISNYILEKRPKDSDGYIFLVLHISQKYPDGLYEEWFYGVYLFIF